jgi:hypothetical protein
MDVTVTQAETPAQPILSVTPANQNVAKEAGTTTFSVANTGTGSMPWTAVVTSGDCCLSITSGNSGTDAGTITCTFLANPKSSRTGTIRVTATGATGSPVDVTVTQAGTSVETVLTFEEFIGQDKAPIAMFYSGIRFESGFGGGDWMAVDVSTGLYNASSWPSGQSWWGGSYWVYDSVGALTGFDSTGNDGIIRFDNADASYVELGYSSNSTLYLEAYDINDTLLALDSGPANLRSQGNESGPGTLRVEWDGCTLIAYVRVHDSGDAWVVDNIKTDATGIALGDNPDQLLIGLGPTSEGRMEVRGNATTNPAFGSLDWVTVDWPDYTMSGDAPTYPALGNLDADPADEVVIGLGPAGNGTIQVLDDDLVTVLATIQTNWPDYNNCGNAPTYPACGDVDGDGLDEIVIGLGETGEGRLIVLDNDLTTFLKTIKVNWVDYRNCGNAPTYPACGNLDDDPADEIVIGLGETGLGRLRVVDDAIGNYAVLKALQVNWLAYRTCGNAPTYPACGDVDGDGQDEIVVGLGETGMGRLRVIDGKNGGYAALSSLNVGWADYINCGSAPTYPACGNLDDDPADEIVVGLGEASMGRLPVLDDRAAGYGNITWLDVDWEDYRNCGSAPTRPACGAVNIKLP